MFVNSKVLLLTLLATIVSVNSQASSSSSTETRPSQSSTSADDNGNDSTAASTSTTTGAGPIPTSGITPCILGCVTPAAAAVGCVFTNVTCVCTNTQFQQAALTCLQATCTPAEVSAAEALQQSQCAAVSASSTNTGTSTSPSATAPGTSRTTTGTTGASSPSSPSASPTGAASMAFFDGRAIVAVGLAAVGALVL